MPKKLNQRIVDAFTEIDLKIADPQMRIEIKKAYLQQRVNRNEDIVEDIM